MEETHDTDKKAAETNKQILHYIREREAALDEVKKIKTELTETQSKLYDALKLVEELEKVSVYGVSETLTGAIKLLESEIDVALNFDRYLISQILYFKQNRISYMKFV